VWREDLCTEPMSALRLLNDGVSTAMPAHREPAQAGFVFHGSPGLQPEGFGGVPFHLARR
jgi:hypothetical protein